MLDKGHQASRCCSAGEERGWPGKPSLGWVGWHGRQAWGRASSSEAHRCSSFLTCWAPHCPDLCLPAVSHLPAQRSRRHSLSSLQGSSPCSSCMMSLGLVKAIPTHRGKKSRWPLVSDLKGYHRTQSQPGNAMTQKWVGKPGRGDGWGQRFSECWEKMTKGREESWLWKQYIILPYAWMNTNTLPSEVRSL